MQTCVSMSSILASGMMLSQTVNDKFPACNIVPLAFTKSANLNLHICTVELVQIALAQQSP